MNSLNVVQPRYDFFLIWGHGLQYKKDIIDLIAKEDNFNIKMIHSHKVNNIKKFVKKVYEYDYVPYFHLRGKTKYLMNTPKEVMFIFIKNKDPQEVWKLGHGTGHIESDIIVKYKNIIRDKFNERRDDRRTENHVIHASDNEIQVHYMLKYLGYSEGIKIFDRHSSKPICLPYFIREFKEYKIKKIDIDLLKCNNIYDGKIKRINIEDSYQYKFLLGQTKEYKEYIDKYQGIFLKAYYDLDKYQKIIKDFNYLSQGYETEYIVVEKIEDDYIVSDGLHRTSILKYQGKKEIIVMETV